MSIPPEVVYGKYTAVRLVAGFKIKVTNVVYEIRVLFA